MNVTIMELEFVELPHLPEGEGTMNNGYLLSMWDCSCCLATWDSTVNQFEDSGGYLNQRAIRSWAVLSKPVDATCWGDPIVRAALANDKSNKAAGWLEPKYCGERQTGH